MQTDGYILVPAVSFGLGPAFHIVQMFNTAKWCCFGSFVILGGAQVSPNIPVLEHHLQKNKKV